MYLSVQLPFGILGMAWWYYVLLLLHIFLSLIYISDVLFVMMFSRNLPALKSPIFCDLSQD